MSIMCIAGGMGGRIIVHATVAGLAMLLSSDEENNLATVNVKGQLVNN